MNENKLPQWAADALTAAGLDGKGKWRDSGGDEVEIHFEPLCVDIVVSEEGQVYMDDFDGRVWIVTHHLPDAFRLAARLAAALKGEPDPRIKELEDKLANHELYIASNQEETIKQLEAENIRLRQDVDRLNERAKDWRPPMTAHNLPPGFDPAIWGEGWRLVHLKARKSNHRNTWTLRRDLADGKCIHLWVETCVKPKAWINYNKKRIRYQSVGLAMVEVDRLARANHGGWATP